MCQTLAPVTQFEVSIRDETVVFNAATSYDGTGLSAATVFAGSDGVEAISGGSGGDAIFGAGGNDALSGGMGDDILIGGAGNDQINGGANGFAGDTAAYVDASAGVAIGLGTDNQTTAAAATTR